MLFYNEDSLLAGPADDVVNGEEVVGEAELFDQWEFAGNLKWSGMSEGKTALQRVIAGRCAARTNDDAVDLSAGTIVHYPEVHEIFSFFSRVFNH